MSRETDRRQTLLAVTLGIVLLLATLGEGGSAPTALLVWHGALVLVWVIVALRPPRTSPPWPRGVALALGAFLLLFLVGWARAPQAYAALLTALELGAVLGIGALAWCAGPRLPERIAWALLAGGVVQGIVVVGQRLTSAGRPAGTFLNPNYLALWLVAVILLAAGVELGRRGGPRPVMLALLAPALAGMLLAGSRGALLALATGGLVLLASAWRELSLRAKRVAIIVLVSVLIGTAATALARLDDYDPFRYHRVRIWQASVASWLDSPWWGSGPGGFEIAAERFRFDDGEGPLRYDKIHSSSHSDPLRVLAELGTPAALALGLAFALAAWRIVSALRQGRLSFASRGAVAALAAIGAQGLVDNPSNSAALYVLAAALWGAVLAATQAGDPNARAASPALALRARAAVAFLLVFAFVTADVLPYVAWRSASALPRGRLDAEGLARLERAIHFNPLHAGYPARWAEHAAAGPLAIETYGAGREAAERAVRLDPQSSRNWLALARLEAVACRRHVRTIACREGTRAAYAEAEQRAPYDATIPVETAVFLLETGDASLARLAAERALALEPESVLPRVVLADALLEEGSSDTLAAELIDEAEARARRWPEWSGRGLLRLDVAAVARLRRRLAAGHSELSRESYRPAARHDPREARAR